MHYALSKATLVVCSSGSTAFTRPMRFKLPPASRTPYWLLALIVAINITASAQNVPAGREQVLVSPFEAGTTHVAGTVAQKSRYWGIS